MKGHNLYHEALAHINRSMKLISMENALDKNPRKSSQNYCNCDLWGNVCAHVHTHLSLIKLFLTFSNEAYAKEIKLDGLIIYSQHVFQTRS